MRATKKKAETEPREAKKNSVLGAITAVGPGLITGASDDDPSGIGTYSMAGAALGYSTLWTALFSFPMMAAVQFICAKIGLVYGCGLATIMRRNFPRWVVYPAVLALVIANVINSAADIQAIAAGINLLAPISISVLILPVGILIFVVQAYGSYRLISKMFRWLAVSLLAYIGAALLSHPNWHEVLRGTFLPTLRFDSQFLSVLVALLGTTISPYLFFWQASHEIEEQKAQGKTSEQQRKGASRRELRFAAWDTTAGMLLSNVVMYFIIFAAAATLHQNGKTEINTATEAAEALRPIAGNVAYGLMAIGLIGTGMLAVPILLGSAAFSVAELFGWECSLDKKPGKAKEFYLTIALCMAGALAINALGVNPMKALFWTAVINGFLAPPILILVMLIANNRKVMGSRTNGLFLNIAGWFTT
ncbi:MAG TPA: Nramp family divalent metal transporter, partial [Pirellulales bacterium]